MSAAEMLAGAPFFFADGVGAGVALGNALASGVVVGLGAGVGDSVGVGVGDVFFLREELGEPFFFFVGEPEGLGSDLFKGVGDLSGVAVACGEADFSVASFFFVERL